MRTGAGLRDCADCPEMVVVSAGTYRMGSTRDRALTDAEGPRHEVRIASAFAVARFEVSRGEFAAFVKETGHAAFQGKGCVVLRHEDLQWIEDSARDWRNPGFEQGDDHPAVCVSWDDAKAYAGWIGKKTGKPYRLLSEAEWEYAARAGGQVFRQRIRAARHDRQRLGMGRGLPERHLFRRARGRQRVAIRQLRAARAEGRILELRSRGRPRGAAHFPPEVGPARRHGFPDRARVVVSGKFHRAPAKAFE
jgi:hypothetical protein